MSGINISINVEKGGKIGSYKSRIGTVTMNGNMVPLNQVSPQNQSTNPSDNRANIKKTSSTIQCDDMGNITNVKKPKCVMQCDDMGNIVFGDYNPSEKEEFSNFLKQCRDNAPTIKSNIIITKDCDPISSMDGNKIIFESGTVIKIPSGKKATVYSETNIVYEDL